jgi:hypothetical protein
VGYIVSTSANEVKAITVFRPIRRAELPGCFTWNGSLLICSGAAADNKQKDSENQPHHAGGCVVFDPLGGVVAQTGGTCIREEMLLADLAPEKLREARSNRTTRCGIEGPNCTKQSVSSSLVV